MIADPLAPATTATDLPAFPIGNRPLAALQSQAAEACSLAGPAAHPSPWTLDYHPAAWLDPVDFAALIESGKSTLLAACGTPLAWRGLAADAHDAITAERSFLITHPWDLLRANEQYVGALVFSGIQGDVHPSAVIEGVLHLGPASRILPGVFIEGNVVVGANSKIGPNCYIRGATSIGDHCHIGQSVEIKNSLIRSHTNIGHLTYLGDSVIGENVNFGAGTIVSNLRHDGTHHRSLVNGTLIDTGRRKFGTVIGDGARLGVNTTIYPGRKIGPGAATRPAEVVTRDIA